jgi:hypothetical protein
MCRSGSYRAELMRNPPPAENIYAAANSYTAMGNGYKAPMTMTEIKTI